MARGLRKGDGGSHLMTFHPPGGNGSSTWFHEDDWLDLNMRQNGHSPEFTGRYDNTHKDYERTPPKPVIDGEPLYEDHPVSFNAKSLGHSIAADVRRPLELGPVRRRVRSYLRASFGVANVVAGETADQQSIDAMVGSDSATRRGSDAIRSPPFGITSIPDSHP